MTKLHQHPFHMVDKSPWPMSSATSILMLTTGLMKWFQGKTYSTALTGALILMILVILWWRDVAREATFLGLHSTHTIKGMKMGFIMFILSEIMFFLSFFWTFFHSALSPTPDIGMMWPPTNMKPINPWGVPLLNTAILLSSGGSLTSSHHSLRQYNKSDASLYLSMTILLGFWFTLLQVYEYWEANFTMADKIYGKTFFVATGFHGLHVMMGTIFLSICLLRLNFKHFSNNHHIGYECAIWYWHFVDVMWIFLFICMYWWGDT